MCVTKGTFFEQRGVGQLSGLKPGTASHQRLAQVLDSPGCSRHIEGSPIPHDVHSARPSLSLGLIFFLVRVIFELTLQPGVS